MTARPYRDVKSPAHFNLQHVIEYETNRNFSPFYGPATMIGEEGVEKYFSHPTYITDSEAVAKKIRRRGNNVVVGDMLSFQYPSDALVVVPSLATNWHSNKWNDPHYPDSRASQMIKSLIGNGARAVASLDIDNDPRSHGISPGHLAMWLSGLDVDVYEIKMEGERHLVFYRQYGQPGRYSQHK